LSRAVDVQPCFNRDVISDLSDQATTSLLELQAWAEGEKIAYTPAVELENRVQPLAQDEEIENQVLQAVNAGNGGLIREWSSRIAGTEEASERISRVFLNTVNSAAPSAQEILLQTGLVDFNYADPINERNCIHEAAVSGKMGVLQAALAKGANIRAPDVYGRLPLHYACMHGCVETARALVEVAPDTVDFKDLDHFTPLIHSIVHSQAGSVQEMLQFGAIVDPTSSTSHIPLNLACQYGSVPIVQQILRYSPQILPDAEGLFPQHLVARFGRDNQILQMLKEYGADMDQPDKLYQWTPIFHAASEGQLACVRQLLEFRVNPSALDEKDLNAMYYAAWEGKLNCMQLLAQAGAGANALAQDPMDLHVPPAEPPTLTTAGRTPALSIQDPENIPDLSLPPPIIPLRRYGHNFLDTTKTFIQLSFDGEEGDAIEFYGDSKYPAARLTISSKSSDLIPRNLPLPIQDDYKNLSFQIEDLDNFSIDFDIYPTFGSKVIARAAASSRVFTGKESSSGKWHLELFDPRLRAIGRISFRYHVVTPFHGIPLEITHFATYWKATSQLENHPSNLITGSSLSGDFLRLFTQVTRDGVPVLYNDWSLPRSRNDLISRLTYQEFENAGLQAGCGRGVLQDLVSAGINRDDLTSVQRKVASSYISLQDALELLPPDLHLEIHLCYPTRHEEEALLLGPTHNINVVVEGVLKVVFDHARHLREVRDSPQRNFVFSSYNPGVCTALNWKQPNCKCILPSIPSSAHRRTNTSSCLQIQSSCATNSASHPPPPAPPTRKWSPTAAAPTCPSRNPYASPRATISWVSSARRVCSTSSPRSSRASRKRGSCLSRITVMITRTRNQQQF
jgi:CDK inhibitor PHO81